MTTKEQASNEPKRPVNKEIGVDIDKKRGELWLYLSVSIVAVEFLIFVVALVFGFVSTPPLQPGEVARIPFPWLSWAAAAIIVPAIMLLSVHLAVGLFSPRAVQAEDEEWGKNLPHKLQRAYDILMRAPAMVLLVGIIIIGVALLTLDGALQAVESFFSLFRPYLLHILAGIGGLVALFGLAAVWLNYRSRKLFAEYEYRREVLEKTGLIIVDSRNMLVNSHDQTIIALDAGRNGMTSKALAAGPANAPTVMEAEVIETEGQRLEK